MPRNHGMLRDTRMNPSRNPAANSGVATVAKAYPYRRSRLCRPGAMKAHSWYSHTGAAITRPAYIAIFRFNMNWSSGLAELNWQLLVPVRTLMNWQYGSVIMVWSLGATR